MAAVATIVYTAVVTFVILQAVEAMLGLRVTDDEESRGLDLSLHEESGYRYRSARPGDASRRTNR